MSIELKNAIESLKLELENISLRTRDIKKTINQLNVLLGEPPEFSEVELDVSASGRVDIKHMQFTGKGLVDAVKEFFKIVGRPATAQETLDSLTKGGLEFPKGWKEERKLKNLAIQLGSHPEFVDFEVNGVKAYGLAEKYPDKKKEKTQRLAEGDSKKRGRPKKLEEISTKEDVVEYAVDKLKEQNQPKRKEAAK